MYCQNWLKEHWVKANSAKTLAIGDITHSTKNPLLYIPPKAEKA